MDPNKSASAPPAECADDTSAPPSYQECCHPGFPQPGPSCYTQPGPGYYFQTGPGYPPHPGPEYPPHPGPEYPPHPAPDYSPQAQVYGPPPQYAAAGYGQLHPVGQQYPRQPGVTVTHHPPENENRVPLPQRVRDCLCLSILAMVCCMPLGLALIYSTSTREANHFGDQTSAERASRTGQILTPVSMGIGISLTILFVVLIAIVVTTSST